MKFIILFLIYIFTFFGFYFLLSGFGLVLTNYEYLEILHNPLWFWIYSVFVGWWIPIFSCREYYVKNEDYFEDVL